MNNQTKKANELKAEMKRKEEKIEQLERDLKSQENASKQKSENEMRHS